MTPDYFQSLARYNRWANARLYDAVAALPTEEHAKPRPGAYFGSLLGTLNHILIGDRLWLQRFEGEGPVPKSLDEWAFETLDSLREAREAEDARLLAFTEGLTEEVLAGSLSYRTMVSPDDVTTPFALTLGHVFNHQTHHRGQAHALVKEAGAEPPPLDLVFYLRENPENAR